MKHARLVKIFTAYTQDMFKLDESTAELEEKFNKWSGDNKDSIEIDDVQAKPVIFRTGWSLTITVFYHETDTN